MVESTEELTARPVELVPVAVAAFEEVWHSRNYSPLLLNVLADFAREEAETRLAEAPERDATDALTLAWGVVWPILERLLEQHGYLAATIDALLAEAKKKVEHVAESGSP